MRRTNLTICAAACLGLCLSIAAQAPSAAKGAAAKGDVDTYAAANLDFHDRLVELAGNAKLLATYRRLVNELNLYRRATLAQSGTLPISTREHREIVDRIAAGHAAAAGRALFEHVMASRERMHHARSGARPAAPPSARKSR